MSMEKTLKEILDEILDEVEQELDEATTTAGVDGYNTPFAFGSGRKKDKKKEKDVATQAGYTIAESINEAIKGRNNKTGESFGMVIGSDKKNREGDFEVTIRKGYSSRISSYGFVFDKDSNLISIKDYGYSMDGKFPDMKGSSSVSSVRPNKRETITQIAKITSPAFAKKIYQHVQKNNKIDESVNEAMKPSQVRSAISKVKKQLMRKWKQKGGYENFGQKELSQMKDKFDYNPYGSSDERQISKMLDGFDNWAMNYDGNMREDINEAKIKRPVNRWLELKNDETMHPHKKMAMGLKELKYQLKEVEKFFNWYNKIKTMNELDSQNYWKRTNNHIYTIKEKLIKIAKTIQEIEK